MDVTRATHDMATCRPIVDMMGRVGDKWTVMVVMSLRQKPLRFNELKRLVGGISQQMLTRTLKALERDGMVVRTVYPTVPPHVEYALTPLGHSLAVPVAGLGEWVEAHLAQIHANRAQYDSRAASPFPSR